MGRRPRSRPEGHARDPLDARGHEILRHRSDRRAAAGDHLRPAPAAHRDVHSEGSRAAGFGTNPLANAAAGRYLHLGVRSHPKPSFAYQYRIQPEIDALRAYRDTKPGRQIPSRSPDRLLLATWNIANLGQHDRFPRDHRLLAEIISWFDLVAIQEVADDLSGLRAIHDALPSGWRILVSDKAGNNERTAYLYDGAKVTLAEKVGEIALDENERADIKLPGITRPFGGFNRFPYIAAFEVRHLRFVLVNVHLYFGPQGSSAERKESLERRQLEAYAVGRWADLRRRNRYAYTPNIVALGDFNLPRVDQEDDVFRALTSRGLLLPEHATRVGASLGEQETAYDQIAFVPGEMRDRFVRAQVFDFDGAVFPKIWEERPQAFRGYVRYYLTDHRPLWAEFRV